MFQMYLKLGIDHILDLAGYDHILFIATLVAVYKLKDWKKVIILATAFTLGHTTTLALATLKIIVFPQSVIEFLIAVTIFLTGFANLFKKEEKFNPKLHWLKYLMAMFFGLIHGLGFSNYLRYLLGREANIIKPLFAFNIGLELGQLVIITTVLLLNYVLVEKGKMKQREWNLVISGAAMGIALTLMIERFPAMLN